MLVDVIQCYTKRNWSYDFVFRGNQVPLGLHFVRLWQNICHWMAPFPSWVVYKKLHILCICKHICAIVVWPNYLSIFGRLSSNEWVLINSLQLSTAQGFFLMLRLVFAVFIFYCKLKVQLNLNIKTQLMPCTSPKPFHFGVSIFLSPPIKLSSCSIIALWCCTAWIILSQKFCFTTYPQIIQALSI